MNDQETAMTVEWLNLQETAKRMSVTDRVLRTRITKATFPAPHRVVDGKPFWPADVVDRFAALGDPKTRIPRRKNAPESDRKLEPTIAVDENELSAEERLRRRRLELLDEVRYHVWLEGSALVKQDAAGRSKNGITYPLGRRVETTRSAYKHGRLTQDEIQAFEELPGWSWDHWDSMWRARLSVVASRFPHLLTNEDRRWLQTQTTRWEELRPEWQGAILTQIGPMYNAVHVAAFVSAAKMWLEENKKRSINDMPTTAVVEVVPGQRFLVGRKMTYYRRVYRGVEPRSSKPMTPAVERYIRTGIPGWTWEMREGQGGRPALHDLTNSPLAFEVAHARRRKRA